VRYDLSASRPTILEFVDFCARLCRLGVLT
jgi:hypothetical protein